MVARRIIAALLVIVASILAPLAVGSLWAERILTDTQDFTETIQPLAHDPQVNQVIEQAVSEAIIAKLDAEARLETVLPSAAKPFAQAVASGLNSAIQSGVTRFVESDRFDEAWVAIATQLHESVNALLRDQPGRAVELENGQLVLDTGVVAQKVQADLADRGVPFVGSLDLTDAGRQIVLADTPNLQLVVNALRIFLPIASWAWLAVLAMFLAGILLWPRRSRGLLWSGLGLALGGAVMWVALDLGQAALTSAAGGPQLEQVVGVVTSTLLRFLVNATLVMVCLGLAGMLAGWLGGAAGSGHRVRTAITDSAHRWGAPLAAGPVGRSAARMPLLVPALRGVVLGLALWWLIAQERLTPSSIAWAGVGLALGLLLVEIVEGAGRGHDEASSGAVATA